MKRNHDIIGLRFGRLTAMEYIGKDKYGNRKVRCVCDCGNEITCRAASLTAGASQSCGCARLCIGNRKKQGTEKLEKSPKRKNAKKPDRLYRIWVAMKQRCYNPNHRAYKYYGARGITVCDKWKNGSKVFKEWALANGYKENLTIDRIDIDGNYEPSNCRWITQAEQNNNRCFGRSKEE